MTLDLAARKRALLDMVGPERAARPNGPKAAGEEDWAEIDAMAAQHRLQPWLHDRFRNGGIAIPVPQPVSDGWKNAYRHAALGALTAQAALVRLSTAMQAHSVPMVALKGSRLAFFDYREAALRPMRDIDILVAPEDLPAALDALAGIGCDIPQDRTGAIARALESDKHLAPIAVPGCDRFVEVHHRIADPGLPCIATDAIIAASRTDSLGGATVAFPSPEHMLGHLVLHAVYNHRFDCGPLALVDIAMLLGRETIDAARFAEQAQAGGWLPGARLVLALVERVMGPTGFDIGQAAVPRDIIANAEMLLLQDFDQREQVVLASQSARSGLAATVLGRLRKGLAQRPDGGRLRWISTRTARTIRQARDPRSRGEANSGAAVARWLATAPASGNPLD
ncbi:nucleotidyltransferase domain-containing protein [Croceicoccus bisphenolivorans]|uniref:nucleotidyltransferase domain-containing protein n=1 Tax=Croceicoccus bisphenolivorans TaxID=1783232 RepID=UPI0008309274|nr:nucleotidyltransferase family protein [Croceicoccus bisphenolivorans]